MRDKRNIKIYVERIRLQIKSQGAFFVVPLIIVNILIPVLNILSYSYYVQLQNYEMLRISITEISLFFVPFFSIWWVLLALKEPTEGNGREILIILDKNSGMFEPIVLFLLYMGNVLVLHLLYGLFLDNQVYEYVKLLMICVGFLGFSMIICKLSRSILMGFVGILLFSMTNYIGIFPTGRFPMFFNLREMEAIGSLIQFIPYLCIGIILIIVSFYLPERV